MPDTTEPVVVAFVDDLMDRSRISSAVPGVRFVREVVDCTGADIVVIDLARHTDVIGTVRHNAPRSRVVGFGPHVDDEAMRAALAAGADAALPRSRFFKDVRAAIVSS